MTLVTVYQAPAPWQVLYTSDLSLISPIFQMRRPNHKEIGALSCDGWVCLRVRARSHRGLREVNEGVYWEGTGLVPGWGGPECQQEPGQVPALQATCTRTLFFFLPGLEPDKPSHPGGQDSTSQSKFYFFLPNGLTLWMVGGSSQRRGCLALRYPK